jgi:predicted DNA-binding protein
MAGQHTKQVGIKMPPALSQRIEAIAARENNGVSAVVRRILTAGIEREEASSAKGKPEATWNA